MLKQIDKFKVYKELVKIRLTLEVDTAKGKQLLSNFIKEMECDTK